MSVIRLLLRATTAMSVGAGLVVVGPTVAYADGAVTDLSLKGELPTVTTSEPCVGPRFTPPGGGGTEVPEVSAEDLPDDEALTSAPAVPVGGVLGVEIVLGGCAVSTAGAGSDGGVYVNGDVVVFPLGDAVFGLVDPGSSGGGPGPDVFGRLDTKPVVKVTYGFVYDTDDGSTVYVTGYLYRPSFRQYGKTYVVWQSGTATIKEKVNLQRFQTHVFTPPEYASGAEFEDYSPKGDNEYEASQGVTAGVQFGVQEAGGSGGTLLVSASRQFGVSHTKFGGDLWVASAGYVYGTRGGYRHIAQGHRNNSRAYSHAAAWTFDAGVQPRFDLTLDQYAYRR